VLKSLLLLIKTSLKLAGLERAFSVSTQNKVLKATVRERQLLR